MKSDHEAEDGSTPSPSPPDGNGPANPLQAECERLRQRLVELEAERDLYKAEALAWAIREMDRNGMPLEEELRRAIEQEDGLPLEAFIDELERSARGS